MARRKIIQLIARAPGVSGDTGWKPCLFALCNDGMVFKLIGDDKKWWRIEEVPQD